MIKVFQLNLLVLLLSMLLIACSSGGDENSTNSTPASWGTAELIETDDAGHAQFPRIAIDAEGNAIAVWEQYSFGMWNILANRFDGASWGYGQGD